MEFYGSEELTIDKCLERPKAEGNEPFMACHSVAGDMTCCLWKAPNMNLAEFNAFIDRYTGNSVINKTYAIDFGFGLKQLTSRGYLRDLLNAANGRPSPGFLDGDSLWLCHRECTAHLYLFS